MVPKKQDGDDHDALLLKLGFQKAHLQISGCYLSYTVCVCTQEHLLKCVHFTLLNVNKTKRWLENISVIRLQKGGITNKHSTALFNTKV